LKIHSLLLVFEDIQKKILAMSKKIIRIHPLGFPWFTKDPFLFCVHHLDFYPKANPEMGPAASLAGRNIGNDFAGKDGWNMYHGETVPGFPAHPHRGFETITYVLQGTVDHADSAGGAGRYSTGDVQWMTAGSGLQHSELFPLLDEQKENTTELFQIWLNLPASKKSVTPAYKMLWRDEIPEIVFEDEEGRKVVADVIAGKLGSVQPPAPAPDSWAADPANEVAVWHLKMEAHAKWLLPAASERVNRVFYFFEGESMEIDGAKVLPGNGVELVASQNVILQNGSKNARCLVLQGKPIDERVVQYGPFVMNSEVEIQKAFSDYRQTQFGGWPWPRHDQVFEKNTGRFARYADGTEIKKDS
jgi:redox-sensitive bicupin YhaK (pirin superfamily)